MDHTSHDKYEDWLNECKRQNNDVPPRVTGNREGAIAYGERYGIMLPIGKWFKISGVVFNERSDSTGADAV